MRFTKRLKETGVLQYEFRLKTLASYILLLKSVITKAQEYKVSLKLKILTACVP